MPSCPESLHGSHEAVSPMSHHGRALRVLPGIRGHAVQHAHHVEHDRGRQERMLDANPFMFVRRSITRARSVHDVGDAWTPADATEREISRGGASDRARTAAEGPFHSTLFITLGPEPVSFV